MQPAHAQQQGRAVRCVEQGPVQRGALARAGEIGDVVGAVGRPTLADDPVPDVLRIGDQGIEALVIFQVIVAAQPADARPGSLRAVAGGPVHPGQEHARILRLGEPRGAARGPPVQRAAEAQHGRGHARFGQRGLASGVGADSRRLDHARAGQGRGELGEIGFGSAVLGRAEQVEHGHRGFFDPEAQSMSTA